MTNDEAIDNVVANILESIRKACESFDRDHTIVDEGLDTTAMDEIYYVVQDDVGTHFDFLTKPFSLPAAITEGRQDAWYEAANAAYDAVPKVWNESSKEWLHPDDPALEANACRNCGQKITDNGDGLWLHNWSKSNNCDPDDPEGYVALEGGKVVPANPRPTVHDFRDMNTMGLPGDPTRCPLCGDKKHEGMECAESKYVEFDPEREGQDRYLRDLDDYDMQVRREALEAGGSIINPNEWPS